MEKLKYLMVVNKEEGRYWAWFPEIPGCVTEGDTMEELRANAKEAVEGSLIVLKSDGRDIPEGVGDGIVETLEIKNDPAEWEKGGQVVKPMEAR